MRNDHTKPQFNNKLRRGNEVFLNRRAVIALTASTVTLLTLLQPNRELLLDMLDDANDPTVALAFLNVLQDEAEPTQQLDYLVAKQHAQLNEHEQAIAIIEPVERFHQTPFQERVNDIYARSLWQLATLGQDEAAAAAATDKLHRFFSDYIDAFNEEELSTFSQYAIQTGSPRLAYELLVRHESSTNQELLALSQQAGLNEEAYQHARQIYESDPSLSHLQTVLNFVQQSGTWQEGIVLAEQHAAGNCDNDCLQTLITFLLAADASTNAAELAYLKAQRSTQPDDWLQATERALAIGDLATATQWLEQVVAESSALRDAHQQRLVDLYVGQQRFDEALALMQEYIDSDASPESIRYAIRVAYAAINIEALENYLYALATQGAATLTELREWIVFADRLNGADYVTDALVAILDAEDLDSQRLRLIEVELGRFYNFRGDKESTIALWQSRHPNNMPDDGEVYLYPNLNQFIQAFVDLNQPETALEIAINYLDLETLSGDPLEDIRSLAYFVGDREALRRIQEIQLAQGEGNMDPYLVIATHDMSDRSERLRLWEYYQAFTENAPPSLGSLPTSARVVLESILQGAIADQNDDEVARVKDQLLNYPDAESAELLEIRLAVATYEQDNLAARELLQRLMAIRPEIQRYPEDAVWIAIALDDTDWLQQVYRRLFASALNDSDLNQLMAYSAQALDNTLHARFWYERLYQSQQASAADLLSYAILLQQQGNEALSQALRWQVVSTLSEELREEPDGDISYRSLLSLFVGPAHASEQLSLALSDSVEAEEINSILFTQSQNGLQRIAYWQAIGMLDNDELSETVQLSLALARQDENSVRTLALQGQDLTGLERSSSLAQIDERVLAWQYGQEALNADLPSNELSPLQRLLANEHWHRSHGWSYALSGTPSYELGGSELEYYRPVHQGQLQIRYTQSQADQPSFLNADYDSDTLTLAWQSPDDNYQLGIQERFGSTQLSAQIDKQWQLGPWFSPFTSLFWNTSATQSENLSLAGRQSGLQLGANWQLTSRTSVTTTLQTIRFESDFNDRIGDSRQLSLRISDTQQRVPLWQAYAQYDLQVNSIASGQLTRLMTRADTSTIVTPQSFLADKFHRFAIGQQLSHGTIGRQGPDVKGARYLLDTSMGYNFELEEIDFNVSFGLGLRIFGGDELSITGSWQNADINGQNSTQFNVKYFMDF